MHHEAEAHRNYRESVSRISRAIAKHVRGLRRLSDYLNATICMRRRQGSDAFTHSRRVTIGVIRCAWPMASRCSPNADDYLIL